MTAKGIFITGTDTGVGKSVVAAVITRILRLKGVNVGILKPVTSGCMELDGRLVSEDAELLAWAAGETSVGNESAPYLLRAPLAPSVAAAQEGIRIDFSRITDSYQRLTAIHDFVVVEGAGGLMVPLAGGLLIADLILHLNLPTVVVARPNLGTINHSLLTTFTARNLGIDVRGVIINNFPDHPNQTEEYAPHLLASLSGVPLLGVVPRIEAELDTRKIVELLSERLMKEPTTKILLREIGVE